ncbi:MAG: hypothetical protein V2I24_14110 [Halieaceae bacterium]|jgi:hypothetical protein|nr:hypothetical protein [Halieaceae bacterium]
MMKQITSLLAGIGLFCAAGIASASSVPLNAGDTATLLVFDNYDFDLGGVDGIKLNNSGSSDVFTFAVLNGGFKAFNFLLPGETASFTVTPLSPLNLTAASSTPGGSFSLDVTAVPIPLAAWLFATALVGLTVVGRRQRAGLPSL